MKCKHIKGEDKQCNANAMTSSSFCFSHNPDTKEAKIQAVSKGGRASKRNNNSFPEIEITSVKDVTSLLVDTVNKVRSGNLDVKIANCIAILSNHLIKSLETSTFERKLEEVEEEIFKLKIS